MTQISKKCPVCSVFIDNDLVKFSHGKPGTRGRLWARVCQYTNNSNCINRDEAKIGVIEENDYYRPI